jgi:beta-galactosidase
MVAESMVGGWLRWPAGGSNPAPQSGVGVALSAQTAAPANGLAFGADYNPEQWPRHIWDDDVRAMKQAGVNIVTLGVFSWAHLQPAEDTWTFEWLDDVMDLLHQNGIAVDLATATASPPAWLAASHPEILPVTARGETLWPGGRQHWRPTSPVFRSYALGLVRELATRYASHPALAAWHISNELGCHNLYDYSDDAAAAFRTWLQERYGALDQLNEAWGTAFWSQRYSDWGQILPPRLAPSFGNPTQALDFKRFSSDALKSYLRAERDLLRSITPDVPITTNFMVMGESKGMDYADWACEVDFVANDHYVRPGPQALPELLFSANLTGHLANGRPWFLMEHSTSAVSWQPVNVAKKAGELARDSLAHVAHGADAVCFFQWRASAAGAERYHSAMVPHAGTDSALFRSVVELGSAVTALAPIAGSRRRRAEAAIVFDWTSWWASEHEAQPTDRLRYRQEALDWYIAFQRLGIRVDVVPVAAPLETYRVVVAPILHVTPPPLAARLEQFVAGGGHLITTYFSGIVDENNHIVLGGYPGALRDLLGIRIEEFSPLLDDETVSLDNGTVGTLWTDRIDLAQPDVDVLASYESGEHSGRPAITRRRYGAGHATYVSTRLSPDGRQRILQECLGVSGVVSDLSPSAHGKVEVVVRENQDSEFWFFVNLTDGPVDLGTPQGQVLVPADTDRLTHLPARGVAALRRPLPAP